MALFYRLRIKEVHHTTSDTVAITLELPEDLKDVFEYEPGQYLTVKVHVEGEEYRRAYSLSSSPFVDDDLTITTKRVDKGIVSNFLNDNAKVNSFLEVMPPMGNFVPQLDPKQKTHYVFFSGGSGITPIFSILKSVLNTEPDSQCTLFYGNRNAESIIFHRELMEIKGAHGERFQMIHTIDHYEDDWKGYKGRMDGDKAEYFLKNYCPNTYQASEYFICGPSGMMEEVENTLDTLQIDKSQIHLERFTPAKPKEKQLREKSRGEEEKNGEKRVKVILDGREVEIVVSPGDTILEAAMEASLDPPYACQIAACATCRARLREGKVKMDDREALTDEEINEGYILTCQAHPVTSYCIVDYDA